MIYVIHFSVLNGIESNDFLTNHIFDSALNKEEIIKKIKKYETEEYGGFTEINMNISSEVLRNCRYKIYELYEFLRVRNMTQTALESMTSPDVL